MSNATVMDRAPRLSALVVVQNEEANLPDCLAGLSFADEIVVVLDRCTDGSKSIAEAAGARLVEGAWPVEGPRRNAGIDACTGDWVLEVDADERVTSALAAEIRHAIQTAVTGVFLIPYNNYIGDKRIRHGWGAYNGVSAKYALFAKGCKTWGHQRVHPKIALSGRRGRLANAFDHYVDRDLADLIARINRDSTRAAQDAVEHGPCPSARASARRVLSRAWKSYVARRGYREGFYGIALALSAALYPLLIYLKARELAANRHVEAPEPTP